jgi:two-component system, cell cycle sensor histidine kinase and response regulator CckA
MSGRSADSGGRNGGAAVRLVAEDKSVGIAGNPACNHDEGYYQTLFESGLDALIVLDSAGRFLDANPAACQLVGLGKNELIGHNVKETIESASDFDAAWNKFTKEGTYRGQRWMVRPDGMRRLIEIRATANVLPGRHFAMWRDVTGRYFLENEFVQRERDQAMVRFAGTIAHDFTNLLNVIAGHAELMTQQIAPDSELQNHIKRILESTRHASALTAQLSALGRQQVLSLAVVDLGGFIRDSRATLQRLLPENVDLVLPSGGPPAQIRIDQTQLTQVLITLTSNAGDHLPNGGRVAISVSSVKLRDELTKPGFRVPSGEYTILELQISNAKPAENEKRLPSAECSMASCEATGAALPAVSATIKQNNAFLWVEDSQRGKTLRVYFPRIAGNSPALLEQEPSRNLGGNETILLVEDDPALREATREYLKCLGYRVLRAGDGQEALQTAESAGHIDALITDLRMPKMGGKELAEKLLLAMPAIKIMFVSGNIDRELIQRDAEKRGLALLPKPFAMRGLAKMLRDLLDAKPTATKTS